MKNRKKDKLPSADTYLNGALEHQSVVFVLAHLGVSIKISREEQSSTEGYADIDVIGTVVGYNWLILQSNFWSPGGFILFGPRGRCGG